MKKSEKKLTEANDKFTKKQKKTFTGLILKGFRNEFLIEKKCDLNHSIEIINESLSL